MRAGRATGLAVAVVVLAGTGVWQRDRLPGLGPPKPDGAAAAFATSWLQGRLEAAPWDGDPRASATTFSTWTAGLRATGQDHPAQVTARVLRTDGSAADAELRVTWSTPTGPWTYVSQLRLRRVSDRWKAVLQPQTAHPQLQAGQRLQAVALPAPRGEILGGDGTALVTDRTVVTVGLQPRRTNDLAGTVTQTAEILAGIDVEIDAPALLTRAQAADPDAFVDVVTLRQGVYAQARPTLQSLPGTVFREEQRPLAPTSEFARALLGTAGPATAEVIARSAGQVQAGDVVGLSGLQAQFQQALAGRDGLRIQAVPASSGCPNGAPAPARSGDGATRRTLHEVPAAAGSPLRLTLQEKTQQAADDALRAAATPSALVAVRTTTGEVLAVANGGGHDGAEYDRALLGQYPPGSTFKIASTLALLRQGLRPEQTVGCPSTTTVNGKAFKNAENHVLGPVPFSTDFAQSCNTAFVDSAGRVSAEQLQQAGKDLGYLPHDLGVRAAESQVPVTGDEVEHAAAMIGQGKVLANPLAVAVSAASVAAGRTVTPYLFADRASQPGPQLDPAQVQALQAMMRQTVTAGTGTALAAVPGGPAAGKTGTAEYGGDVPPRTHAWFAGYQNDVAFAVLVEDGGFGAETAAPVAAEFLRALQAG